MNRLPFFKFFNFINHNLIKHRPIIVTLAIRELRVRYKGSILGFIWTFANPLLMMIIYSKIFGSLLKTNIEHYSVYVFGQILLWNAINGSLNDGAGSLVSSASLVTKVALPPEIMPARVLLTHFLNYALTLPLYIVFRELNGMHFSWHVLQVFFLVPLYMLFVFSIILGLSALVVMFRDIQYLVGTLTFALFFTVPATYPMQNLSESLQKIFLLSPFTLLVKMNADAMFFQKWVNVYELIYLILWTLLFYVSSILILRFFRNRIAERI